MATKDESDQALTADEVREQNFEAARRAAEDNAAVDVKRASVGTTDKEELKADGGAPREIPAHPKQTETTNPEQVALEDESTSEAKTEALPGAGPAEEPKLDTQTSDSKTS